MRASTRGACALLVAAALVLTSCSLGEKKAQSEAIVAGVDKLVAKGTAFGVISVAAAADKVPTGVGAGAVGGQAAAALRTLGSQENTDPGALAPLRDWLTLDVDWNPGAGRAGVGRNGDPVAIFDGTTTYVYRRGSEASGDRSRRAWATLDLRDLEARRTLEVVRVLDTIGAAPILLNPTFLLDLMRGALAGSVKLMGPDLVGEEPATRYKVNVSIDKAESELRLPEPERDARRVILRELGITSDVLATEVWLDASGVLRKMILTARERPVPGAKIRIRLSLYVAFLGQPNHFDTPTKDDTVKVDDLTALVRNALS